MTDRKIKMSEYKLWGIYFFIQIVYSAIDTVAWLAEFSEGNITKLKIFIF